MQKLMHETATNAPPSFIGPLGPSHRPGVRTLILSSLHKSARITRGQKSEDKEIILCANVRACCT